MKGLFYKELYQLFSRKGFYLISALFLYMVLSLASANVYEGLGFYETKIAFALNIFLVLVLTFMTTAMSLKTLNEDEQTSFSNFALSSPISYKNFVLVKYAIVWLFTIFNVVYCLILLLIFQDLTAVQLAIISLAIIFVQTLLPAIVFPVIYKFGTHAGRVIFIMSCILMIAFVKAISDLVQYIEAENFSSLAIMLALGISTILINGISYGISVNAVRKNDLNGDNKVAIRID